MKVMKPLIIVSASVLTLWGCNGGSDDGDRNVSGTWQGALTKTFDDCNSDLPQTLSFNHTVAQVGAAVTLRDQEGTEFVGNTVSDDGFSVDFLTSSTAGGGTCQFIDRIEYRSIDADNDDTATVDLTSIRDCTGSTLVDCRVEYTGTASRVSGGSPNPSPTANPGATATPAGTPPSTTTPVAGGCAAINPNPAAGMYQGDGGCGLSETVYRFVDGDADTVILEPFGANGATTFNIATSNPASGQSVRSDLTIRNDSPFSCSLTCSAPGTFTVRCVKEGGTQCVEKF